MKKLSILIIFISTLVLNIALAHILNVLWSNHTITSSILVFINSIILIYFILRLETSDRLKIILIAALLIRVVFSYIDLYARDIVALPNSGMDTENFDLLANTLPYQELSGYPLVLKILYALFGHERLFVQFINIVFMMLSMIITIKIMTRLKVKKSVQEIIIAIFAFLPSNIILSSILLREPMIILLSAISLYSLVEYIRTRKLVFLGGILTATLAAAYLHSAMVFLLIPYVFILSFYNKDYKIHFSLNRVLVFLTVVLLSSGLYIVTSSATMGYFNNIDSIESATEKMSPRAEGGSVYLPFTSNVTNVWQAIIYSPLKFIYFFGSPFPWDWRNMADVITFLLSSILYIYMLSRILIGKHKSPLIMACVSIVLVLGMVHAWGVFNTGTAMRHREKLLVFILVGFALYLSQKKQKRIQV